MMRWYFLAGQLDQRVSDVVYFIVREVVERTSVEEGARMSAILACLDCSKSESEEDDTREMHAEKWI